jgi:hypothetical protein
LGQATGYQVVELKFVSAKLWIPDGFGKFQIKNCRSCREQIEGLDH